MARGNRALVTLECTDCKERNYNTNKNKRTTPDKLEFSKYCSALPQAHGPQGNEVGSGSELFRPVALTGRAADSKSAGWGFESLLACQSCEQLPRTMRRRWTASGPT